MNMSGTWQSSATVNNGSNSKPSSPTLTMNQSPTNTANGVNNNNSSSSWFQFADNILQKQHSVLTFDAQQQAQAKSLNKGNHNTSKEKSGAASNLPYLSDASNYPEVKEYMHWRLKRNQKRLQRLQLAAQMIQTNFRAYLARKLVRNIRRIKAARLIQRVYRGYVGRKRFFEHVRHLWAAITIQKHWRGYFGRRWYFILRLRIAAAADIQRLFRGHQGRQRVKKIRATQYAAACVIQAMFRRNKARREAWLKRKLRNCSITIQRIFRGFLGRKRSLAERDKYIFSKSQSQGIEFGRQMLLEHKLHVTRLQSDVTLLTQEKVAAEEQIEALLEEISGFEDGVRSLEKEMHQLSKVEAEAAAFMDEDSKFELREQKMRLDREFGEMLTKIANRKEMLNDLEKKLAAIDKTRQGKEEDLRTLERKLVVLLEDQQKELSSIRRKQDIRGAMLAASHAELSRVTAGLSSSSGNSSTGSGGAGSHGHGHGNSNNSNSNSTAMVSSGPSLQEKKQAAQLMQSTETLMKFGFMSMSMTYFSSLNMIKALRTVSAQDTVMAALADVHAQRATGFDGSSYQAVASDGHQPSSSSSGQGSGANVGSLKRGQLPGQQQLQVSSWSVDDVTKWLQTLSLGQYAEAFADSAVDGEFLYDLNDDDLKNTLGIEHRLHRKKILNCVARLKMAEAQHESRLGRIQSSMLGGPDLQQSLSNLQPNNMGDPRGAGSSMGIPQPGGGVSFPENPQGPDEDRNINGPKLPLPELFSLVRHSKFSAIKDAIDYVPNKTFDKSLVQVLLFYCLSLLVLSLIYYLYKLQ